MSYYLSLPVFLLLFVVLQHSLLSALAFNILSLELSLVIPVYAGFRLPLSGGALVAVLLGFIMDCIFGTPTGFYLLLYLAVFVLSYVVSPRVYAESPVAIAVFTLVCGVLEGAGMVLLNGLIYGTQVYGDLLRYFLPQLFVVAAASPFLFYFFDRVGLFYGGSARTAQ